MHPATYGSSVQTAIPVGDTMPAYAATGSAPACPQSSVVEEQSWEAPLRYESAASSASSVSQSNFVRNAGRPDGGTEACHESPTAKRFSPRPIMLRCWLCCAFAIGRFPTDDRQLQRNIMRARLS